MPHLYAGEVTPNFFIQDSEEKTWTQNDLKSKWTLLHFQTQVGDDMLKQIYYMNRLSLVSGNDFQVLGIAVNNKHNQKIFIKEHGISFPVLLDEKLQLVRAFGTWEPFKGYHKSYMNVIPSLFLINQEGLVIWKQTHIDSYDMPQLIETHLDKFYIPYNKTEMRESSIQNLENNQESEEDFLTLFEEELVLQ